MGVNLGVRSDIRLSGFVGRLDAEVEVGDPIFPSASGQESAADLTWRYDGQDSPVIPTAGLLATRGSRMSSKIPTLCSTGRPSPSTTGSRSSRCPAIASGASVQRIGCCVAAGIGETWGGVPMPHNQFVLGAPFRLGAHRTGEIYGPNYYLVSAGYLRQVGATARFLRRAGLRRWLARERRCLRRVGQRDAEVERQRRRADGHADWTGIVRRIHRFRRQVANVHRHRADLLGPAPHGLSLIAV